MIRHFKIPLRLAIPLTALLFLGGPAVKAAETAGDIISSSAPASVNLDSLTLGMFYSVKNGGWLGGGTLEIYRPAQYISLDTGVVTPTGISGNASVIVGVNAHAGEYLATLDPVKRLLSVLPAQTVLKKVTVGGWCSRDFTAPAFDYGAYIGMFWKFGG
ncbi:MAG: hypothetical protein WC421_02815 [Elusimicrobiales bacterium]